MTSIQEFLIELGFFINSTIIPLLFALALLFFIFNTAKYFIINGDDKREEAKQFALYGVLAFVVLVSIWGVVNLIVRSTDIDESSSLCPDYLDGWCGDSNNSNWYGGGF